MAEYLHGAYGQINTAGSPASTKTKTAMVYIGTAPVNVVEGGASNVNKPILATNLAEAKKFLGYSEDFASFTLCEAMKAHFEQKNVGPLVFINVLNPNTHVSSTTGSKTLTPENGRVTLADAALIILDSVTVKSGDDTLTKGTDYAIAYNSAKNTIVISELTDGSLGTSALTISYKSVDPSAVTTEDVIGSTDGSGLNTGIYATNNVLQVTGYIPSFLLAPGFSSDPDVYRTLTSVANKVNGHWSAYVLADIPIADSDGAITLATAATWKKAHSYTRENSTVYFPLAEGTDGLKYHLSTLAAANLQELLSAQDGIPYKTASNTKAEIIENLYLGEDSTGRVFDDTVINEKLNKNGIASAAFVGGHWAIWGAHSADYSYEDGDYINVAETNRMMLYYLSNDFQYRRAEDVDKPKTANDIQSIIAEEQARLDALLKIGALTYGEVHMNAEADAESDIVNGDFSVVFNVTTTPLAKSLTATINWTEDGFETYFSSFESD